jgi:hypothetical protein
LNKPFPSLTIALFNIMSEYVSHLMEIIIFKSLVYFYNIVVYLPVKNLSTHYFFEFKFKQ